ncbi:MAG: TfoX/Sxy family protein [Azoarcus sp.]|nr:TfoX/Sxy family protein [Azoarcus sp.]
MATSLDFVEYIAEQVADCGAVRYKKMFGEYMVYIDEKPILLVCDNTVFVKMLHCLDVLMKHSERGYPYKGAKEHYVLDIDNTELARAVVSVLLPVTPIPVPRKKRK